MVEPWKLEFTEAYFYIFLAPLFVILALNGFFGVIACGIAKRRGKKIKKIDLGMRFLITFLLIIFLDMLLYRVKENWVPPVVLNCGVCLTIYLVCSILRAKIISGKKWKDITGEQMGKIFSGITAARNALDSIDKKIGKWVWWLAATGCIALAIYGVYIHNYLFCFPLVGLIIFAMLLYGMHSCRILLLFWLFLFFVLVIGLTLIFYSKSVTLPDRSVLFEITLAVFLTLVWSVSIGVADHDVGKMAAAVVNTLTTVLLIILGVLIAYGEHLQTSPIWNQIETAALYILLPFVIAGYVAALFKESQIYWEKKYTKTNEKPDKKSE